MAELKEKRERSVCIWDGETVVSQRSRHGLLALKISPVVWQLKANVLAKL